MTTTLDQDWYLIVRVEQHESDDAYPYLQQQQRILSAVVDQAEEVFPLQEGEDFVFSQRPDAGTAYIGVRLSGCLPTETQLEYLRTVQIALYSGRVATYEVISGTLFQEREKSQYYFWSHDRSAEIALHEGVVQSWTPPLKEGLAET